MLVVADRAGARRRPAAGPRRLTDVDGPTTLDGTERGLDPRVRTVWALGSLVPAALVAAAGVVAGLLTDTTALVVAGVALGVALAVAGTVGAGLAWRRWRWSAWPDALELRHGVIVQHASLVPYHRIQQIDVERGPLERALGLAHLVLRTASATSDASLPGIPAEDADDLRRHLLARAGIDDAV